MPEHVAVRTPDWLNQRSLALHRLVVARVRLQPEAMVHVRDTLARWQREASPRVQAHLADWQAALAAGDEVALALAVEDSPHADTLRQCSPFCGVLTPRERHQAMRELTSKSATANSLP